MKMASSPIDLISKKTNCTCSKKQICTFSTLFCLSLAFVLHDYNAVLYDQGPLYMGWGTPVQRGWFLLFSRSGGHKTKETYPTRPGFPTPCKQGLKRPNSQLHIIFMEELSYMLTQYFVSCVHVRFYLSLPLIFALLAASISHFLTAALNFHVFLPTNFQ